MGNEVVRWFMYIDHICNSIKLFRSAQFSNRSFALDAFDYADSTQNSF